MGDLRGRGRRADGAVGQRPDLGPQPGNANPLAPVEGFGNQAIGGLIENAGPANSLAEIIERARANMPAERVDPQPARSAASPEAAPAPLSDRPRTQVWPSKDARKLDELERGELKLEKAEAKQLRKRKGQIHADAGAIWLEVFNTVFADHPEWLDERALRADTPWTQPQLRDIGLGGLPMAEFGETTVEAAYRELNASDLARTRMSEVAADNERGDRYELDYDDWALEELEYQLGRAARDGQVKAALDATKGDNEGMIISESHGDVGSWRFLFEQMPSMRENEVMTLYLEHFRNSEYQPMLDAYIAGNPDEPMPANLHKYIRRFDRHHNLDGNHSLMGVVTRAKEYGLRIVGIDDMAAKREGGLATDGKLESRAARMNVVAEAIVAQDQQRFGKHKFVMLMGAKHTHDHTTGENTEFPDGIAGVAQLLNLIAVRVGNEDKLTIHRRGED